MNSFLLNIIVQTIPKVPADEYNDAKLVIKSRKAWKKDIFKYILVFISAIICLFIFDKLPVPYVGNVLVFYGFIGTLGGFFMILRSFMIYKHYYDIFQEDDIKKIED
ncbi:MAG: hypothetical protein MJ179_10555 [Treponema sp.]|nr:hypothetical protein [Treponema sp.]